MGSSGGDAALVACDDADWVGGAGIEIIEVPVEVDADDEVVGAVMWPDEAELLV